MPVCQLGWHGGARQCPRPRCRPCPGPGAGRPGAPIGRPRTERARQLPAGLVVDACSVRLQDDCPERPPWRQVRGLPATARKAVVAVDGLARRGPEGHFRLATAAGAGGREHLARCASAASGVPTTGVARAATVGPDRPAGVAATGVRPAGTVGRTATAAGLSARTARGTTSRLAELAISVELLLARRERELLPAVGARESLVLVQRKHSFSSGPRDRLARTERGVSCCRTGLNLWPASRALLRIIAAESRESSPYSGACERP